ncbi:hypothetical protein CNE_BB1p04350 (plasmid) [Cupriavidus necator N-1]|uniref:Zn-ribbon domain-containing OB-fold protein n=1 Tax=Cupriavidus necator (strain ATCC 43291 / DSM 13513 / CCUG 52238 / LMG 8453 / N-1) TaxID=1042878 RepID=F8GWY9_CUPNN|nr:OB-fold domain-containing protein [Cupriavidus necator]AEI81859.1 hypothetical protein CNE_BB1p04350 [Cupriavidus necator N-1]MDX6008185.1 OB-fold domain-containing protein [Cupriavidus necator]
MTAKPKPKVSSLNAPYWEGTAVGELRLRHCQKCEALFRFTHPRCPCCWSDDLDWKRARGKGTVATFTVVHVAPFPAMESSVPYILALVDLEEGVRMMCNIVLCDPLEARIGMAVSVAFEDRDGISLPQFKPSEM